MSSLSSGNLSGSWGGKPWTLKGLKMMFGGRWQDWNTLHNAKTNCRRSERRKNRDIFWKTSVILVTPLQERRLPWLSTWLQFCSWSIGKSMWHPERVQSCCEARGSGRGRGSEGLASLPSPARFARPASQTFCMTPARNTYSIYSHSTYIHTDTHTHTLGISESLTL